MKKFLIIICSILILTGCGSQEQKKFASLESEFKSVVKKYYDNNVVGVVYPPFSCTELTISKIQESGISVQKFIDEKCDLNSTAAFVIVSDSSDPANIKYEIISNLKCGNNSSTITNSQKEKNQCISSYFSK